jgi:5'-3' exonuclease
MIAIIDGDVLAYQACRPRWEKKADIKNGISKILLDGDGKRVPLEFTKEEDRSYLEESWANFKDDLQKLLETVYCTDFLMAVKGDNNFRNTLYPDYKMNRHKDVNKQNLFVPTIRKLAVMEDLAIESTGCEADDLMCIWAHEAREVGEDYIICSIDKDLKCIPGRHYWMRRGHEKLFEMSEPEAIRFQYEQFLKGDPTDNILGVPRVGEVKAAKILAPYDTEEEFQECVVEQYMLAYGDEWEEQLIINGRLIYLQKHKYDFFSINNWPVVKSLKE